MRFDGGGGGGGGWLVEGEGVTGVREQGGVTMGNNYGHGNDTLFFKPVARPTELVRKN